MPRKKDKVWMFCLYLLFICFIPLSLLHKPLIRSVSGICWSYSILQLIQLTGKPDQEIYLLAIYINICKLCSSETDILNNGWINRAQFLLDLTWPQGRFIDAQNYNELSPNFWLLVNPNFIYCFFKEKMMKDWAIKSWNRR